MRESEEYPGPSLVLACSHCIAHGHDLKDGLRQQELAAMSGYWPLIRYNPTLRDVGRKPFVLDSPRPTIPLEDYACNEMRYKVLLKANPQEAADLMRGAPELVDRRWETYEYMAEQAPARFQPSV